MDGLTLDVPAPSGSAQPLTDLLAAVPTTHLIAAALFVLFFVAAFDSIHPQRGGRR
jgi:hypothetical protein